MEEIDFPPDVRTMLWILLGEMPLQARENLAWESRQLYLALQKGLIDLRAGARETIQMVEEALPPEVAQPYIDSVRMLTDMPGGNDPVQRLLHQLDELANGQIDYSQKIQGSKWDIIAEIIMLLAELALLAALMAFTGGASVSQMFLARARSKLAILMIIDRLLRMSHIAPTLGEAITEAIQSLGTQLAQIALNKGGRRPDGVDWKDVAVNGAFGALTSGFMEFFDKVLKPVQNYFKDLLGDVFDKFKFDRNSLLFKGLTNGPPAVVTTFVVGGAAESTAEVIINGAFYDKWEFKWETFVGSGTSTLFDAGAGLAIGAGAFSIYNSYFDNGHRFPDVNDLPGPGSRLGGGDPEPSGSGKPGTGFSDGPYGKGPSTVKSGLFTPGPVTPLPNTVSTDLPDGVGSGIDVLPPLLYTPPPVQAPPSALNTLPPGGSDAQSGPFDLTPRTPGTTGGTNGFSGTSGSQVPYLAPPTPSPASTPGVSPSTLPSSSQPDTTPLTPGAASGRASEASSGVDADLTTPDLVPDLETDLASDPMPDLVPGTSSGVPGTASDLPHGVTAPRGSSTVSGLSTTGGANGTDVGAIDPEETPGGQDGTRDVQGDTTGQELPGRGTAGRATGGQPDVEGVTHRDAPPVSDAEAGTVVPPAPVGTSAGPTTTAYGGQLAPPSAPQGAAGSGNQSQQSSQGGPADRNDAAELPDQEAEENGQDGQEEPSDGTERTPAPSSRDGAADEAVPTPGASTDKAVPDGPPAPATPPAELRTSSGTPQPDAPSAPGQLSRAGLTGEQAPAGEPAADPTGSATDTNTPTHPDSSTDTDTVLGVDPLTGPTPEPAVPVADPVRPEQWRAGRHDAPAVPVRTGQLDPATEPGTPEGGRETLVRAWVQRIQADDGRWMSNVSLHLPVRTGDGFAPDELGAFQKRMQTLLDTRLNNGLLLPRSGDQLHIDLTLTPAPGHFEAVELSRSPQPDDTDQVHWRLHTVDPAASPEETAARQARDDAAVLHKLLNYAGVPDRGPAAEALLRRMVRPGDGGTAGPGPLSDPAPAVPLHYLETIENAVGAGGAVLGHPLAARGTRPRSGVDDPARAPQMLAPDRADRDTPIAPATPVRTASATASSATASSATASSATAETAATAEGQPDTAPPPAAPASAEPPASEAPLPASGKGKGRSTGPGTGPLGGSVPVDGIATFPDGGFDHTLTEGSLIDDAPVDDAIADELALAEARREHGDALSAFDRAVRTAGTLTGRVESGRGGADDAARLHDAWLDVEQAQRRLDEAGDRLRELGADAAAAAAADSIVPRVRRTDDERRRTAALVTADDLPADPPLLAPDDTLTSAALTAAGVTLGEGPALQAVLNGSVRVGDSGLAPLDHVRLLMTRPGPWSDALDAVAARAARRTWSAAYQDFVLATDRASGAPAGTDPAEAWQRAVSLVLPLELHPVLADSRHARGDFREAVRQVAEYLAVHGVDAVPARELASRVRRELGLPPRLLGGAPGVSPVVVEFGPGSSSVGGDERRELRVLAGRVAAVGLSHLRAGLTPPEVVLTGYGRSGRSARGRVEAVAELFSEDLTQALVELGAGDLADSFDIAVRTGTGGTGRVTAEVVPPQYAGAVAELERLRLLDDPGGAFDVPALTRRILYLPPDTEVSADHRTELFALVENAMAVGWSSGVASLGAYHLAAQGVLGPERHIVSADGSYQGLNLTGQPVGSVDTSQVWQRRAGQFQGPLEPMWNADQGAYVVVAEGGHDHVLLPGGQGGTRIPWQEFVELVARDPGVTGLPAGVPVVLVLNHGGDQGLVMPRTLAFRAGRDGVWAHSGQVGLVPDPATGRYRIVVENQRSQGVPLGGWFGSDADDLGPGGVPDEGFVTAQDGTVIPDRAVKTRTIAEGGRSFGRVTLSDADLVLNEPMLEALGDISEFSQFDPVTKRALGDPVPLLEDGRPVYHFAQHGMPLRGVMEVADGRPPVQVDGVETGRFIRRRPSMRKLGSQAVIDLGACWADAVAEDLAYLTDAGTPPYVFDVLGVTSYAQDVANGSTAGVLAVDRVHVLTRGATIGSGVLAGPSGEPGGRRLLLPEPDTAQLTRLARWAGLHPGAGPAPLDVLDTTMRLVRALRRSFGADVHADPAFGTLLQGIGALENMRRADRHMRVTGPFTLHHLHLVVHARHQRTSNDAPAPDEIRRVLSDAARKADEAAAGQLTLHGYTPMPSLDWALKRLAGRDLGASAVNVLRLPSARPVTQADVSRLVWGTVKGAEALRAVADPTALAKKVLHLPAGTDLSADQAADRLLWLMAGAAVSGFDPSDPADLAAWDLVRHGALDDGTRLMAGGVATGRNWTGRPVTGDIATRGYVVSPDGSVGGGTRYDALWPQAPSGSAARAYLIWADSTNGHVSMPWPDGSSRWIPGSEIAALLRHDRVHRQIPLGTPLLVIGTHVNPAGLAQHVAGRSGTARTTVLSELPSAPVLDPSSGGSVIVLAGDPAQETPHWQTSRPADLPGTSAEQGTLHTLPGPSAPPADGDDRINAGAARGDMPDDGDTGDDPATPRPTGTGETTRPDATVGRSGSSPVAPLSDHAKLDVGRRFSTLMRDLGHPVLLAGRARARVLFGTPRPLGALVFELPADIAPYADPVNEAVARQFPGVHRHALRLSADGRTLSGVVHGARIVVRRAPQAPTGSARPTETDGFLVPDVTEALADAAYILALATDGRQRDSRLFDLMWGLFDAPKNALPAAAPEALRGDAYRAARPSGAAPGLAVRLSELLDGLAGNPEAVSAVGHTWLSLGAAPDDLRWMNAELHAFADALSVTDAVASDPVRRLASQLPDMAQDAREQELAALSPAERERLASDPFLVDALRTTLSAPDFAETAAQLMVQVPPGVEQPVSARREVRRQIARMLRDPDVTAKLLRDGARVMVVPRSEAMTSLDPFRDLAGRAGRDGRKWDEVRGVGLRIAGVTEENLLGESTSVPGAAPSYPDGYSTTLHEFAHTIHMYGLSEQQQRLVQNVFKKTWAEDGALWPDGLLHGMDGKGRRTGANYSSRDEYEFFAQLTNVYFRANAGRDAYTRLRRANGGPDWVRRHFPALFPLMRQLYGDVPDGAEPVPVNPVAAVQEQNEIYEGFRALWDQAEGVHVPQPHEPAPAPAPPAPQVVAAPAAPPAAPPTVPGELSEYARTHGTRHDGHVGLVIHEPTPDPVLDGLHGQIIHALGVDPAGTEGQELRAQLRDVLSAVEIELNRPYLRSRQGHRITLRQGGRDRSVDVRLAYADTAKSARYGRNTGQRPPTLPDVQVELRAAGGQTSSHVESSGTLRTASVPWSGISRNNGTGALRWWDATVNVTATHNQLAQSVSVGETFQVTSKQQAEEPAHPIDVDGRWQVQVDAPREDPVGNWQPEQSHGSLTMWFHEHLAFDAADSTDLPEPGDVDDLPLWGGDSVAEPRRLLTELLQDQNFGSLRSLDEDSERALENFLSQRMLQGTPHLQRTGGVFSPTLLNEDGNAVGVLELTAVIEPGRPVLKSAEGKSTLETWFSHSSSVDRSAKRTSGLGVEASGGSSFTTDRAAGHPRAVASFGGNVMGKAGVNWQVNDQLNSVSSATLMHGIRTKTGHLLTPARVTYTVTLHRAGGGQDSGTFGPWEDGLRLRIARREAMAGHRPGPDEVRELPEHLEHLTSIGYTETPLRIEGADPLFARAEVWLRDEGFLPPAAPRRRSLPFRLDEPLVVAQLENLRRLRQMRSTFGLAASAADGVDGGEPVWFDRPHAVSGTRRVQLRFSVARDYARPANHARRLPDILQVGFSSYEAGGGRRWGAALSGSAGGGGGFHAPVNDGAWGLNAAPDYLATRQITDTGNTGDSVGYDQFTMTTRNGSELFEVPARLALDLYEGPGDDPRIHFADDAETDDGAADGTVLRAPGATPHTVPGDVTLLVPHYRTHAPATSIEPAVPRPGHVIREPVTDGGPTDDRRRLNLVDAQGHPLPGLTRLPEGALVDTFRGSAALLEALGQIVAGTYPGHPEQGPVRRAVRRASVQLSELAAETARRGSAVKEALPESLTGAVNRAGSAVNWAATPVTWAARTSVDGVAATYKWTSVAVAGASLNDQGTLATETRHDAIRPAQLMSRAAQILDGAYVVEGLTLPGMAADQVMMLEISGYLTNPRNLGSESLYTEQDVAAADTAGRQRGVGVTHQGNFQLTALQSPPTPPDRLVHQTNPAGRYSQSRRTDDIGAVNSTTKATHATEHSGDKLWVGSDLTLLLTVRWGVRNVAGNAVGLGTYAPVTVAVDLPRAVTYLAPAQSVARLAAWFGGMQGLPGLTPPQPGVPLPGRFVRTRQLGKASVLTVTQLDDTTNRRERRDRIRQELVTLVEREAPGATRPGHASYVSGVATEITRTTEPAALRALPRRGPGGHVRFHFVHVAYGGARLVEVTLSAEPVMQTPALRGVRGRPADEGTGMEQVDTHIPQGRATSSVVTTTRQGMASLVSRYPRTGGVGLTDRTGPSTVLSSTRSRAARSDVATEDRFWTRSGSAADFDVDYRYTASVRSQVVWQWPANIPGAVFQDGLLNLSGLEGDVAQRVRGWIGRLLRGRPVGRVSVPAATTLRFIGSEAVESRLTPGPRPPALLTDDPLLLSPSDAAARSTLPFPGGARLQPSGPTPVYDFNAASQLAQALREVDPRMARAWRLPANASSEATAVRLGEMIQAGEISLDPSRTAAGLTPTMPGSWPVEAPDSAPSLSVSLHRPRPVTETGDVAVDRVRRQVRTSSTASSTAGSFVLNQQGTYRVGDSNSQMLGVAFPVVAQQPHAMSSGGNASASVFSRLRIGTTSEPTDRRGTRSYETLVDLVVTVDGPGGVRYVTGSSTARLWERDVLGFGVTPPRPGPGIYDLPAMLADLDSDDLRDWERHPVTDLPSVLAGGIDEQDASAEMWLALGPDPDGTRLARALFVGSRTAALAGKPVELVVRTDQGLRYWPFDADGSLADSTEATHDSWEGVRHAVGTYLRAVGAEATARHREDVLTRRRPGALRALEGAGRAVGTATTAHRRADLALADAVRTAGTVRSELTGVRDRIGATREEIARLDATARDAQNRYEAAADEELRLREQGQQARTEVDRLGRLVADAETTPAAASRNDLAAAEEYAGHVREREAAAVRQRQLDLEEMTTARAAADELRTTLDADVVRETALAGDLARAEAEVSRAERTERQADAELRRRTGARDAIRSQLGEIEKDLATARQELAEHARRHSQAWEGLPGLTSALETGRRAESIGAGPSLRGSVSSVPARPTRSGRFGGQPLPAPPPEGPGTAEAPPTASLAAPIPAPRPALPPAARADLATRLPGMTEEERTSRLLSLSSPDREALASDPALAAALRQALPADAFARTAALLMVDVPAGVDLPVSSGIEARAQVARMLRSPAVAERMLTGGARLIVVPKDAALTSLDAFGSLRWDSAQDGRPFETVRGLEAGGRTAVGEENLLGDSTGVPGAGLYADGYSAATHEFAHAVHRHGLTDDQRRLVTEAFHDKVLAGSSAAWPDGPLYDASGTHRNYSSRNEYEFFAQLTNAYLGTNTGTDPYTGRPRNNGSRWVRRHEPALLPLLRELYGTEPRGTHPWQANPRTEADVWAAFRAMWDETDHIYRPQPHAPGPALAPKPASGPRPVLGRADLVALARRVAGREAVGDMSVQRCLVLLGALRDALYPRGVRPAVAVDDAVVGDPSAASSLVPGPGWRGVRSWDAVAGAVAAQGPGAVAFVLARRRGGALGHAWAAYHLGGFDGVVWVDASAGAGRQVSAQPPAVAASEAQALVLDPAGQAVEHALPEFTQSSSTAHTVLDAATGREYGALGLEVEKRQWFTISGIDARFTTAVPTKQVLAHAPGLKIVTDHASLWRTADGRMHLTDPPPVPGEPQPRSISYLIGEVVLEPMAVLPGERRQSQEEALARLDRVERALDARDELGSAQLIRLSDLLPAQDGWQTTELGDKALVGRSLIHTTAAYVQPTTGLPALGLSELQDAAVDRVPHAVLGMVDMSGRDFGMKATADFVRAFTGRTDVPEQVVPFLSPIPDIDELWGYLRLGYAHTVARPVGAILNQTASAFMVKNGLVVASRHPLDRILRALRPRTRTFLDKHHDGINARLAVVLGRVLEAYRNAVTPDKPFFPGYFDATIGDVPSPREHMTSVLTGRTSRGEVVTQKQMVDMDDDQYPTLDTDDGRLEVPLVLTELRHFGYTGQFMTPEEIRRAVAELSKLSREVYRRALTHRAPLPEDVLRDAITRVLDNDAVRGLAHFVQTVLLQGLPQQSGGYRRLMSVGESQRISRALGEYALGTPLPEDGSVHRALRTAVDEASKAIDTVPPPDRSKVQTMVGRARDALEILADPERTPPVMVWASELVAQDGARVPLDRVLVVGHRDAEGRPVGTSSRPVEDWQDAHRHAYGLLPEVESYTFVRRGPVPLESPAQTLPFDEAYLVGLHGGPALASLALSDGSEAVVDYARVVDLLFAVDGHLTALAPERPVLVVGADLAGAPAGDPLDTPLAGEVLADGLDRWVWATGSGAEPVLVPADGSAGPRWQLAEGDWWVGFRPGLSTAELGRWAEQITGRRDRAPQVRRWVRAIRLVYGPLLENDSAAFEALLTGFWALEQTRAANDLQASLTWSDLRSAVSSHFAAYGQPEPPLPVALQFLLLSAAGATGVDLELSRFSIVPQHASVRAWGPGGGTVGGVVVPDAKTAFFAPPAGSSASASVQDVAEPPMALGVFTGPEDFLLSAGTLVTGPSGRPQGRNWTGRPVGRVEPGTVQVVEARPGVAPRVVSAGPAPWPETAYVVAADGEDGRVRLPDGRVLDAEGLAAVLAADPELAKLPTDVPVVLAVPFAGQQYQETLRNVAVRLGRTVWGTSGVAGLALDESGNAHVPVLTDPDPDALVGAWVKVLPPAAPVRHEDRTWTALDGTVFRDSDVDTVPLVDENHERFGRLAVGQNELRLMERRWRTVRRMRRLAHWTPAGASYQESDSEPVSMDAAVYVYAAHGLPGRMALPLRDGRTVWLGKRDAAAYIAGLPEVRALPPGHRIHLEICWSASDGDPHTEQAAYAPVPHVDDPLGEVPLDQHVANLSRMVSDGATRPTGLDDVQRLMMNAANGERGHRVQQPPEPLDHELDRLAREVGLHAAPGVVPVEVRDAALRVVRALRRVFGNEIEDDRGVPGGRYERVLKGVGALERMRANDPALSPFTPFRMDLLDFYVQEHTGRSPDRAGYLALLDFAAARVAADPTSRLTDAVPAPALLATLRQLAARGEQITRHVQSLSASAVVTPRQAASTLWATARASQVFTLMTRADRETMGRKVLHLDASAGWERSQLEDLWMLLSKAIAQGVDVSDHDLLAAYHLKEAGAFGPGALLWQGFNVQGFNWSDAAAPTGINWGTVFEETSGPGDITPVEPEWVGPGRLIPTLRVVEVDGAGTVVVHLPGRAPVRVQENEFLALLGLDPELSVFPLGVPVLFLTTGAGALSPQLVRRFSQSTGRPAFGYSAPMMLMSTDDPLASAGILTLPDPATGAPGHWTAATRQPTTSGTTNVQNAPMVFGLVDSAPVQAPGTGALRIAAGSLPRRSGLSRSGAGAGVTVRRPLSRSDLVALARRVAGREPVRGMSVERCLVLLGALREALYPRGVRPAVAVDD
ncbi:lonely Cys domain-containing protein, partial [Streptomyces sp. NPDC001781]